MKSQKESHKKMIKDAIDSGAVLDPRWAWNKIGCSKLSTRIGEMERDGMIAPVYRYRKTVKNKSFTIYSRKRLKQYEKAVN